MAEISRRPGQLTNDRAVESGGPVFIVRHGIFPRKFAPAGRKIPAHPIPCPKMSLNTATRARWITSVDIMSSQKPLYDHRIMRLDEVLWATSLSRTLLYELIKIGAFPPAVRVSARRVGWRQGDIMEWLASRPPAE